MDRSVKIRRGQLADGLLLLVEGEVHGSVVLALGRLGGLTKGPGQAQAEDGDQVALDLVGPSAEGQDDQAPCVHLEPPGQHRVGMPRVR